MQSQSLKITRADSTHIEGLSVFQDNGKQRWTSPAGGWLEGSGVWKALLHAGQQGTIFQSDCGKDLFFLVGYSPFMKKGIKGRSLYFEPTDAGEWVVLTDA